MSNIPPVARIFIIFASSTHILSFTDFLQLMLIVASNFESIVLHYVNSAYFSILVSILNDLVKIIKTPEFRDKCR